MQLSENNFKILLVWITPITFLSERYFQLIWENLKEDNVAIPLSVRLDLNSRTTINPEKNRLWIEFSVQNLLHLRKGTVLSLISNMDSYSQHLRFVWEFPRNISLEYVIWYPGKDLPNKFNVFHVNSNSKSCNDFVVEGRNS